MLDAIEARMHVLSPAQRRVAQVFRQSYPESVFATAEEISERAQVSRATFVRTLAALEYPGLVELQREVRRELADLLAPPDRWPGSAAVKKNELELIAELAKIEIENIEGTFSRLPGSLPAAASAITEAERVLVIGERKARALATYLAVQLAQVRRDVIELGSSGAEFALQLADLNRTDAVVLFDLRRYGRATHLAGTLACSAGATVISIADSPRPPTAQSSDFLLMFETRTVSPFLSYASGVALIDTLIALVVRNVGSAGQKYSKKVEQITSAFDVFEGESALDNKAVSTKKPTRTRRERA